MFHCRTRPYCTNILVVTSINKPFFVEVDDKDRLLLLYQTLIDTPTCFEGIA